MAPKKCINYAIKEALEECVSSDYPTTPRGFYCDYDFNEWIEDMENEDTYFPMIGLGDFLFFDLLLLFVVPFNSSIITKGCIAFICIIVVQFGNLCTRYMGRFTYSESMPGLPFPTVFVTTFAVVLDAMGQYLDTD